MRGQGQGLTERARPANLVTDVLPLTGVFALHLVFAFASGWLVVAAVTTVADAKGTGRAGFLGGVPSTGAVSLLFIGWSQSQSAAVQATAVFPLAFSVTFAFLLFYSIPGRAAFGPRMAAAILLWFVLAAVVALSGFDSFPSTAVVAVLVSSGVFLAHRRLRIGDVRPARAGFDLERTVWRGALGGCVVTAVVVLSEAAGPLVGGAFAAAPAVWTSSLYVTSRAHGVQFSRSLTNSFMVTGILTVIPYGVAARLLFPVVGIWWGTLLSYVAMSPAAWLAWRLTRRRGEALAETGPG